MFLHRPRQLPIPFTSMDSMLDQWSRPGRLTTRRIFESPVFKSPDLKTGDWTGLAKGVVCVWAGPTSVPGGALPAVEPSPGRRAFKLARGQVPQGSPGRLGSTKRVTICSRHDFSRRRAAGDKRLGQGTRCPRGLGAPGHGGSLGACQSGRRAAAIRRQNCGSLEYAAGG